MSVEVMDFVRRYRPALLATVSPEGVPNVAPKGSLTVLDDERLVFADLVEGRTTRNLQARPNVAVVVLDPQGNGYQIKGRGSPDETGSALTYLCEAAPALKISLPPPSAVMVIDVDEVTPIAPVRKRQN
ncbi:MAG: pyridoxamine 5'-phosphate oxidase family protein [Methanomassiliicoccus sp.]|nr:pyridoxamine 5'-phosphate oxidase family protein [Methanomassiliicoccus sp.]